MPQVRVNVRSLANVKAVREEKRNGRDVVIVPSATLPDDVVMNGIRYPAEEIEKSYASLNRTPAPLGHPTINGKFVSARDPEGMNVGYIGAWNENVVRKDGRVFLDKVIDVEVANRTEGGKAVLAAIEKGEAVHTSTGLLCTLEAANDATDHKHIARNMMFDHDAILLGEAGAATPEQGVGMLVNAKGEQEEIQVINSSLTDAADQEIDWAGTRLVEAFQRRENIGVWDKVKSAIMEAMGSGRVSSTNAKEDEMTVTKEQFDALSAEVKALSEGIGKTVGETVANAIAAAVKPLTDAHDALVANQKTQEEAEKAALVDKIVKANILSEASAKDLTINALKELAGKIATGPAAPLNPAFKGNSQATSFKLPKGDA